MGRKRLRIWLIYLISLALLIFVYFGCKGFCEERKRELFVALFFLWLLVAAINASSKGEEN